MTKKLDDPIRIEIIKHGLSCGMRKSVVCDAAGVSLTTFNKEYNNNPNFKKLCDDSTFNYTINNYQKVFNRYQLVQDYIDAILNNKVEKTTTITKEYPDGSMETQIRVQTVLPNRWILERYLPQVPQDEIDEGITIDVNFSDDLPILPDVIEVDV